MESVKMKELDCSDYLDISKYPKVKNSDDIVYYGKLIKGNKNLHIKKKDLRIFCNTLKEIIESGCFEGFLMPPTQVNMAHWDSKREIYVGDNLMQIHTSPREVSTEKSSIKDVEFRIILLSYFKCSLTRDQMNAKFSKHICCQEGEIPYMWD